MTNDRHTPGDPVAPTSATNSERVSATMRIGGAWSWRFLVMVAAAAVIVYAIGYLSEVTIPIAVAALLSALLNPAKEFLIRKGMPAKWAAPLVFVVGFVVVFGLITLVVQQFVAGVPSLVEQANGGLGQVRDWLKKGPFHISSSQIDSAITSGENWLSNNRSDITSGALSTAGTAGRIVTGLVLSLFTLFFFIRDGRRIWNWLLGMTPEAARPRINEAAERSWTTLTGYVKATVSVAAVDAIGIGVVLLIVGVPLAFPLAALVFLTAFIPIIGAVASGLIATLVALVAVGPGGALIVLGGVLLVNQAEAHLLQPILMGRAVKVHPLAVVLALTTGAIIAGIIGALLAVPIAAVINTAIKSLRGKFAEPVGKETESDANTPQPGGAQIDTDAAHGGASAS
ncbi:MAG: AI-2E family transporter [Antricoccus sp.]